MQPELTAIAICARRGAAHARRDDKSKLQIFGHTPCDAEPGACETAMIGPGSEWFARVRYSPSITEREHMEPPRRHACAELVAPLHCREVARITGPFPLWERTY